MVKLYHATSKFSWDKIQEVGFIGMTEEILLSYVQHILETLGVLEHKRLMYYNRVKFELDEYAPNGQVSFFPNYSKHQEYGHILGKNMGEAFGFFLKNAVKYASRVTRTSYKENLTKFSYLVQDHIPTILIVDIPASMIANSAVLGTSDEHYTYGVVPVKYVIGVEYLTD